jgi:hypothetical protein
VAVDVQEVKGFAANTKEFAVFVQNNCMAKSVVQLNFHDSQCKVFGVSMLDGPMDANPVMPQHAMR